LLVFYLAISTTIMDDDLEGIDKILPCTYVRLGTHERTDIHERMDNAMTKHDASGRGSKQLSA